MSTTPTTVGRRVAILDDHELLAESLEIALSVHGYDVRRVAVPEHDGAPAALVATVRRARPRVLLLDLDLGGFGDGTRLIAPLARAGIRIVVLTGSSDRSRWGGALAAGARTVVPKSRSLIEVISSVRRINDGLPTLDGAERDNLVTAWRTHRAELGDNAAALHAGIGERARQHGIDRLFAVGPLSAAAVKAFGERGEHFSDKAALAAALKQQLHGGVTCLIKGSRSAGMDQVVAALRDNKKTGEGASDAA